MEHGMSHASSATITSHNESIAFSLTMAAIRAIFVPAPPPRNWPGTPGVRVIMKSLWLFCLLAVSPMVIAWECGEYDRGRDSLSRHFEIATEVFFGTVMKGEVDKSKKYGHDLEFLIKPTFVVKGELASSVKLLSSSSPPFDPVALGANYLVFLYGSNEIDYCGIFLEVPIVSNRAELYQLANRTDLSLSKYIMEFISIYEAQP